MCMNDTIDYFVLHIQIFTNSKDSNTFETFTLRVACPHLFTINNSNSKHSNISKHNVAFVTLRKHYNNTVFGACVFVPYPYQYMSGRCYVYVLCCYQSVIVLKGIVNRIQQLNT